MRRWFDIVAIAFLTGWIASNSYDFLEKNIWPKFGSVFRSVAEPPKTNPAWKKAHLRIAVAGDDAVGTQRFRVEFQQGSVTLPSDKCLAESYFMNADLVVLGAYEGRYGSAFEIVEGSEAETASLITVLAAPSGKAVVLVVNAYDPVIWDFQHFPAHRLKAVIAFGYEAQAVANLSKEIPVVFNTRQSPHQPCGDVFYAYEGGRELDKFARNLESVAGRRITRFNGAHEPQFLAADAGYRIAPDVKPAHPEKWDMRASAPMVRKWLLPDKSGIEQLVDAGAIRAATNKDIDDWHREAAKAAGESFSFHRDRPGFFLHDKTYVVSKAVEIPSGLIAMDALDFIVQKGVPRPRTSEIHYHNEYYFIETGTHGR